MKLYTMTRWMIAASLIGAGFVEVGPVSAQGLKTSCENLASVTMPHTQITSAQTIAAGAFRPPAGVNAAGGSNPFADAPAFCRVMATISPVAGSTIHMEVWLPSNWNGTFQGEGNGLWGGNILYNLMASDLRIGAATASTDDGHVGTPATPPDWYDWQSHPEQIIDLSWRAFHDTTLNAKALIAAYYSAPLTLSYLIEPDGRGTRNAIREVQQFPEDYDAVVAGGLATHQTHHPFGQQWWVQAVHRTKASYIPPEKFPAIHQAALRACHAMNGVILDPSHCKFDPAVLSCKGADAPTCLTVPQVAAARQIYSAPTTSDTHKVIFGPLMPGSELLWGDMDGPHPYAFGAQVLAYLVFKQGANWDPATLKFDSHSVALADVAENNSINSWNPDISAFVERGGKLLLMGGWNETQISTSVDIDYYQDVLRAVGREARGSVRLFMVPGMAHAPGRTGPYAYDTDLVTAIKQWQSTDQAPDTLIFTHWANGAPGDKLLVCAYPQVTTYKGSGDVADPANYVCKHGAPVGWESVPVSWE